MVRCGTKPKAMAASPNWRSRSTRATRLPVWARPAARFVAMKVLPVPPLVLKTTIRLPGFGFLLARQPGSDALERRALALADLSGALESRDQLLLVYRELEQIARTDLQRLAKVGRGGIDGHQHGADPRHASHDLPHRLEAVFGLQIDAHQNHVRSSTPRPGAGPSQNRHTRRWPRCPSAPGVRGPESSEPAH